MLNRIKNFIDNHFLIHVDKLLDRPNVANGLIEKSNKAIKKSGDYVLGGFSFSGAKKIKADGNFEAFMPEGEQQNIGFEKMWCVSENGICNQTETVFNYFISLVNSGKADNETKELVNIFRTFGLIVGDKCLLDTAYVAVGSGTTKRGNGYSRVANFVRKYGFIPKGEYPNYGKWRTWNELYYQTGVNINGNTMPKYLLDRGKKLAEYVDITYDWITTRTPEIHEMGVPGVAVYAWTYPDANGIYSNPGYSANHSVYATKKPTDHRLIGDSYNPFKKKLALNYAIGNGMLLSFRVKKPMTPFNSEEIKKLKARGLEYVLLVNSFGEYDAGVYELLDDGIKKAELKLVLDNGIKKLADDKKLTGISTEDFKKMLNIF